MKAIFPLVLAAALCVAGYAREIDYATPDETLSPNHAYGVLIPIYHEDTDDMPDPRRNEVIEIKTGHRIALLAGDPPAYDRELNHHGMGEARWSADNSLLLWKVHGKWNPDALELVKISEGHAQWQLDLLHLAQQALLTRTHEAEPKQYAAAKKENAGNGRAFPDGFTVDVTTEDAVSLPMAVHADLTANPKGIEDYRVNLDSWLDAEVTRDGRFVVKAFHLGTRPPQP